MAAPESLLTYTPEAYTHEACPVRVKARHVTVPKGVRAYVEFSLHDADGDELDLSELFPDGDESESGSAAAQGTIQVKLAPIDIDQAVTVDGECLSASTGQVRFRLPAEVANMAGIYRADVGLYDDEEELILVDHLLVFVEPTLFGDTSRGQQQGPPTIKEIRAYIRDTATENDLLQDVEFDEAELVQAIIGPLRLWNESLPPVGLHTTRTFPYKEHWIKGIIGHLYRMAAAWYSRNRLNTQFGGTSQDDRNKHQEYDARAQWYEGEFRKFMMQEKARINIRRGFASIDGPYY